MNENTKSIFVLFMKDGIEKEVSQMKAAQPNLIQQQKKERIEKNGKILTLYENCTQNNRFNFEMIHKFLKTI
jgi:hypothetical protein